ncbi:hypothetical protein GQ53DRAFT_233653 [Thozetella sp. PMI_491]|nr:hypothetical protein GQ53DRAFT_233653 [Thozetella sp. PMI_491]
MSVRPEPLIASVADVDETSGDVLEETRKYARSYASPTKERSNTSKPRKESRRERRGSISPPLTDSDSTAHPAPARRESRPKPPPKDKERSSSSIKKAVVTMRPAPKHAKTMPPPSSFYGVPATVTTSTSRPRGQTMRPASYYATSRPPQANTRWYPPPHPSPAPMPASYPAQAYQTLVYPNSQPVPAQADYFSRPLEHRFGRPVSAMGFRPPSRGAYDDYEQENERPVVERPSRRTSLHKKLFKPEEDQRAMHPPARPATTRPVGSAPFRPPTTPARRSLIFDDDVDLFQDISPQQPYDYGSSPVTRGRARRPSIGATSIAYDTGLPYHTEIARRPSRSGRRDSYLPGVGGYKDKLREATAYQNDVGTATIPLTEESLRKANKNSTSSRSTRSSDSQDESDYRHSATTRTTRSSGEEDVTTIRARGNIKLTIGDAEMRCEDGAEISFSSTRGPGYRGGSDKSSYMDQDDRRTRFERPAIRARTNSQAGSFSRALPMPPRYDSVYDAPYAPYEAPPYPPYPPAGAYY